MDAGRGVGGRGTFKEAEIGLALVVVQEPAERPLCLPVGKYLDLYVGRSLDLPLFLLRAFLCQYDSPCLSFIYNGTGTERWYHI